MNGECAAWMPRNAQPVFHFIQVKLAALPRSYFTYCCVRIAVLWGFRNSSLCRRCARLREVLPSTNHSTGFRPVRGYCKLATPMSKIIRRFRDIAACARPPTAEMSSMRHCRFSSARRKKDRRLDIDFLLFRHCLLLSFGLQYYTIIPFCDARGWRQNCIDRRIAASVNEGARVTPLHVNPNCATISHGRKKGFAGIGFATGVVLEIGRWWRAWLVVVVKWRKACRRLQTR